VADAGVAIVESSWTGTNAGALFGAKATYRPAGGVSLTLTWFAPGGLIREQHVYSDADSVAIQLGLAHGLGHEKSRPFEGLPTSREEHSANGTVVEQANVELVKAGFSRAGLRDSKGFLSWIAEDAEYVDFTRPGSRKDRGGVERWFRAVTTTPSDSLETALNVWGIEDYVIREHAAEPHRTSGVEILQIQGGKLVRGWGYAR
jgi:ketosteroid isomerase-like protein